MHFKNSPLALKLHSISMHITGYIVPRYIHGRGITPQKRLFSFFVPAILRGGARAWPADYLRPCFTYRKPLMLPRGGTNFFPSLSGGGHHDQIGQTGASELGHEEAPTVGRVPSLDLF